MGALGVVARLLVLAAILVASYVLAEAILYYASSTARLLGETALSPSARLFESAFALVTAVIVATLFTAPLALAMFGRAGAWIRHVASKATKYLVIALVLAFGLELAAEGAAGFASPASGLVLVLALAVIGLLAAALTSPLSLLEGIAGAVEGTVWMARSLTDRHSKVAAVELTLLTTKHVRGKARSERVRSEAIRFQRLVQALGSVGGRVEFRLSFRKGRGRVFVLARGQSSSEELLQHRVLSVVKAHLPEFGVAPSRIPDFSPTAWASLSITGVPEATENPLEPICRFFMESEYEGDYQLILEKAWTSPFRRFVSKERQKRVARKAEGQRPGPAPLRSNRAQSQSETPQSRSSWRRPSSRSKGTIRASL